MEERWDNKDQVKLSLNEVGVSPGPRSGKDSYSELEKMLKVSLCLSVVLNRNGEHTP